MLEDPVLRRVLDAVHHLTDPEPPWLGVLEGACGLIGGESATFIMVDAGGQLLSAQQWNVDPEAERVYREHYVQQDIITPKALGAAPGTWLDTAEFFDAGDLSGNAYYADYMIGPNESLDDVRPPRTVQDMRAALRAAGGAR